MKRAVSILLISMIALAPFAVWADEGEKEGGKADKRDRLDAMAKEALDELFGANEGAKALYDKAAGWAVFDNLKISFGISGGGGNGVAVDKSSGDRTYMKMGTGGVGLGLGGKKYQVIFLFEKADGFTSFVEKGWQADTQAGAAAGTAGASAATTFHNGLAIFQITEKGLVASADISGTKYWKNKKLND
jgi:lipid-binding SYLF domain-containing protein